MPELLLHHLPLRLPYSCKLPSVHPPTNLPNLPMLTYIFFFFIFYTAYSIVGHGGAFAYLKRSTGKRLGTPWTGRQSITGQHRDTQNKQPRTHPFTPKGNLERPINLTVMFWTVGGSWSTR
ncbi:hypothetical protein ATANTOWER_012749 [Ataeniobius toweri]|uniref:Uncharacterized protein n=1 Tax=Ataeniobius toweri TaxID=208326 RepID=A0ABU7B6C6_9TELE|nr:hypothetical protein [Ataeniobius toweri]